MRPYFLPPTRPRPRRFEEDAWRVELALSALPAVGLLLVVTTSLPNHRYFCFLDKKNDDEESTGLLADKNKQKIFRVVRGRIDGVESCTHCCSASLFPASIHDDCSLHGLHVGSLGHDLSRMYSLEIFNVQTTTSITIPDTKE